MNYAKENDIQLELNGKDIWGYYPLLNATYFNNLEVVKLIMDYAKENNIQLELNEKNNMGYYPLLYGIANNNADVVKLILDYAKENGIKLELNEKDIDSILNYRTRYMKINNILEIKSEIIKLLLINKNEQKLTITLNENNSKLLKRFNEQDQLSLKEETKKLFDAIENENIEKIIFILKNSNKNKKILNLNEKDENGDNILLIAIYKNNIEIVQLLIKYANQHQIILKLNEKDKDGFYPLLEAISNNNIEIIQLLIEYALQNKIIMKYNKNDYSIKNSNPEIKKLLDNYEKEKDRKERERIERERVERERLRRERLEKERLRRERLERERMERERLERKQLENEKYVRLIKSKINNNDEKFIFDGEEYFEWKIENCNNFRNKFYNYEFTAYNHKWKLVMISNNINEDNEECIDFVLYICDNVNENIWTNFVISIRNYYDCRIFHALEYDETTPIIYNNNETKHGFDDFISKSELYEKSNRFNKPLLENNKIIIGIYMSFYKMNYTPFNNNLYVIS